MIGFGDLKLYNYAKVPYSFGMFNTLQFSWCPIHMMCLRVDCIQMLVSHHFYRHRKKRAYFAKWMKKRQQQIPQTHIFSHTCNCGRVYFAHFMRSNFSGSVILCCHCNASATCFIRCKISEQICVDWSNGGFFRMCFFLYRRVLFGVANCLVIMFSSSQNCKAYQPQRVQHTEKTRQ